ncbi:hypothetical protein E2C01_030803 [Portunus trituberculatus]|uniref:Uncharacterized protein n=1 Tax=Portunus trituberculatus TaxID=210409 RepID=A0A5B7EWC7_PORTR|nr:hypothetical protein [Portunus trituberculatus]
MKAALSSLRNGEDWLGDQQATVVNYKGAKPRGRNEIIETPLGLRQLEDWNKEREFSGFREERPSIKRIISLDGELKVLREMVARIFEQQEQLITENLELRERCKE